MSGRILFIHYTPPGVIGGVEHIMHEHARLLSERGFAVEIAAGRDSEAGPPVHVVPQIETTWPENARVEAELDRGVVSPRFFALRAQILRRLRSLAEAADTLIVHNAFTLHFSLPLTSVLWELAARRAADSVIAWCHDLAWTNPLYVPRMHQGYPWELLRTPAPSVRYVTVSDERREELLSLWGRTDIPVAAVPNGIDVPAFLRLSPETREIVQRYSLLDRDAVLLLPVRVTRRKNIEAAIGAVRCLKDMGLNVRFVISGPQAPHHPGRSDDYLESLVGLSRHLKVSEEVVFLARDLNRTVETGTVAELYSLADVLLFPSAQEGFGLPILEAGLARVPIVLTDIQIFREVGGEDTWRFDTDATADTIAGTVLEALDGRSSRLRRAVLRRYRWDVIVDRQILPLLRSPRPEESREATAAS